MKFTAYERTLQGTGGEPPPAQCAKGSGHRLRRWHAGHDRARSHALFFALKKEAFHSSLLDMELGGKTEQVLLRDYQMHPFRPIVLHIDFQRVDATTKITKKVPLHFVNEENSPRSRPTLAWSTTSSTSCASSAWPRSCPSSSRLIWVSSSRDSRCT